MTKRVESNFGRFLVVDSNRVDGVDSSEEGRAKNPVHTRRVRLCSCRPGVTQVRLIGVGPDNVVVR